MSVFAEATNVKFFTEGLWCDEAFSWALASKGSALLPLTARDFNPPLYYLVLHAWMAIVGTSEVAMRSLSLAFFGLTLVPRVAIYARRQQNCASSSLCVPGIVRGQSDADVLRRGSAHVQHGRVSCGGFHVHVCLAQAAVVRAVTTAALYTHYFVVLLLVVQAAIVLLTETAEERRRRLAQVALPLALLIPWMGYVVAIRQSWESTFWIQPPGKRFVVHLVTSIFSGHEPTFASLAPSQVWVFTLILVPVVLWSVFTAWRALNNRNHVGDASDREFAGQIALLLWALLPGILTYGLSFVKALFLPRYLIFSTVGLLLLMVSGVERARRWAQDLDGRGVLRPVHSLSVHTCPAPHEGPVPRDDHADCCCGRTRRSARRT